MARYVPMELVNHFSGKVCEHSEFSFAKRGDTLYTMRRCNKRSTPVTEKERAIQTKFKAVSAATQARMKDPTKIAADQAAFKEQSKYKTFYRFIFNLEWEAYVAE